ncbi:hypothetical protein TBLA_0B10010 [Henningerozyma blattae CBS 6284]|uniref:Uncharacterized protein n=1 Tax=Henningerozyma blattae (strain ATCC 34711 / CBS 6284 / DSM 70876 / NBRC 10599 / NRRL Y-10934 / UCD 77-7) TaxID=1071380 RepID=I2H0B6_HENB6|nr:hypothetical protein TBLA_0B10010 [Tetrapisispora blattae CBS 6284]CCH59818.1 hypothetical protein TBLA_0B10010 [Tetrapisispora blattae CBS 6284]
MLSSATPNPDRYVRPFQYLIQFRRVRIPAISLLLLSIGATLTSNAVLRSLAIVNLTILIIIINHVSSISYRIKLMGVTGQKNLVKHVIKIQPGNDRAKWGKLAVQMPKTCLGAEDARALFEHVQAPRNGCAGAGGGHVDGEALRLRELVWTAREAQREAAADATIYKGASERSERA